MKKRWPSAALAALMLLLFVWPALAAEQRVFDRADLFTASEQRTLESAIARFQQETGMDFVVLTSTEAHDGNSQQQISDAFYDQGGFGLDEDDSGILYYIDMYERTPYLCTTGAMIDYMTDSRIDQAHENSYDYLRGGQYAGAVQQMLASVRRYVDAGIPEDQYRYDVVTGKRLTARHKVLEGGEILVCALAAAGVGLCYAAVVTRRYKLKGSTYRYGFRENARVRITSRTDDYLRTTVTRTRKPDPPSGGGGHGGGGGGSGVHTSSGGRSHGGGAGRSF